MATNIVKVNLESPRTVNSIVALEALNVSRQTGAVYLDAGGRSGWFKWDSTDHSTATGTGFVDDDSRQGIYVAPSSDATGASGAWVRNYENEINVQWFGAVGDASNDDTAAIQAAIDFGDTNSAILIPSGTYKITSALVMKTGTKIYGQGWNTIIRRFGSNTESLGGVTSCAAIHVPGVAYVNLKNLSIRGESITSTTTTTGVLFTGGTSSRGIMENVEFRSLQYALKREGSVWLWSFTRVECTNCEHAFYFLSGNFSTGLTFNSCWAQNCGTAYLFSGTVYSTFNSCAADYISYKRNDNPYGNGGFGSKDTDKAIYHFTTSTVTLNSCGAENSYGRAFSFCNAGFYTYNSCILSNLFSEYEPNYATYGSNLAWGVLDTGPENTEIVVNNFRLDSTVENTYITNNFPTRAQTFFASNYSVAAYGAKTTPIAFINGNANVNGSVYDGLAATKQLVVTANEQVNNPRAFESHTVGTWASRRSYRFTASSGSVITIPLISQNSAWETHSFRIRGVRADSNPLSVLPFQGVVSCRSLNSLSNVSLSSGSVGITSAAASGMDLEITLSNTYDAVIFELETVSLDETKIDFDNVSFA